MQIQIINVAKSNQTSKAGKPYEQLEVTFKNITYGGKVEAKKLMPFGENKNAFEALKNANNGDSFDVTVVKNTAGFNDWPVVGPVGSAPAAVPSAGFTPASAPSAQAAPARGGWETPEERAKKQVYIIRQSSLSTAVAALSTGSKTPPEADAVITYAKQLEAYVFELAAPAEDKSGFDTMFEDVPL